MTVRIGINGFGRIGRNILRARPPALLRRGRCKRRRGRARRAVFRGGDVSPSPRGLRQHQRKRMRGAAERVLPGAAINFSKSDCRLRDLVDDLAHAGRRRRLHDRLRGGVALAGLLLRRCFRRCSGFRHDELNAYGAARHERHFQFRRQNKPAALNDVRPASAKSDGAAKGFIDRAGAVQAWSAKFQALSAKGRIISALPGANSLVAVPSRTRPMMP